MVAAGITVEGIRQKFKELFNVDLRDNQITGRIADVKKRATLIASSFKNNQNPCHFPFVP
jgi:hypothetical protein